jgi:hypothetical protein
MSVLRKSGALSSYLDGGKHQAAMIAILSVQVGEETWDEYTVDFPLLPNVGDLIDLEGDDGGTVGQAIVSEIEWRVRNQCAAGLTIHAKALPEAESVK